MIEITPRLEMRGIAKRFGATQALKRVDLTVAPGEVLALIGENGAGKSTLMKILSGAIAADAGTILLDGETYAPDDPLAARQRGVAMIYQELTLAPHLSVEENIALGATPNRFGVVRRAARRELARAALAQLGRDDLPLHALAGELPVAQQQMVEIARALVGRPRLVVMDEPTSTLGRRDVDHLMTIVRRLRAGGVSVIYISHVLEECAAVADRWTVLRDGESVDSGRVAGTPAAKLIELMVGRAVEEIYPRVPHALGETVLRAQNVRGTVKPNDVSFTLRRGEILGLYGLVGSGRTETLRALFGLDRLVAGMVELPGRSTARPSRNQGFHPARTPHARLAAGIGMLSEDRKGEGLLLPRSIADNLTITRLAPYARFGVISGSLQRAAARAWMTRLAIKAAGPEQQLAELSGGNQQKVAIGRLLHHGADVLLFDEPTRGVDVGAKAAIYRLIGELAAGGAAVLMVSSYIPELIGICDSIAVMRRGVTTPTRPVAEWSEASILAAAIVSEEGAAL